MDSEQGSTALMLAVVAHRADIVKMLLEAKADIDFINQVRSSFVLKCLFYMR